MKRTLRYMLMLPLLALPLLSASWDGTKGPITITTIGDQRHVAISIDDADQTVSLFSVVVSYKEPCQGIGCTPLSKTTSQFVPRIVSKLGSSPAVAVFEMPLGEVTGVLVTEWKPATSQVFSGD